MKYSLFSLVMLWGILLPGLSHAQTGRVDIINTDVFSQTEIDGRAVRKLLYNVHLRQDDTDFFCDSAYHYVDSNLVVAMSRVKMLMSRNLVITSDRLTYDGDKKIANLYNNITMRDSAVTLRTNRLTYYREANYGRYFTGGTLENGSNVLTSTNGVYYPNDQMAYFNKNVKLVSQDETDTVPDYTLLTDSLGYNTDKEIAYFLAPTRVYNDINRIYTEDGYYDTQNDVAYFTRNAQLGDTSYSIYADTIFYNQKGDKGYADGNIILVEADSGLTVYGQYAEFESRAENAFITKDAYAIQILEEDTLFLFGDTLFATADTNGHRIFRSYNNVRIFMNDLQGIADSLVYLFQDSMIFFYQDPVLWSDINQILGDTIKIFMKKSMIDSMSIPQSAFISSVEDTVGFNQIKGKSLAAKFKKNKLHRMWILGNSESIYYTKDDQDNYFGMNQAKCQEMKMNFEDNSPSRIVFIGKPDGVFYPLHEVLFKEQKLDGFVWRIKERPDRPKGLFMIFPEDLPDSLSIPLEARPGITGIERFVPDSLRGYSAEASLAGVQVEAQFPEGFYIPKKKAGIKGKPDWKSMPRKERKALRKKLRKERREARKKRRAERKAEKAARKAAKKSGKKPDKNTGKSSGKSGVKSGDTPPKDPDDTKSGKTGIKK